MRLAWVLLTLILATAGCADRPAAEKGGDGFDYVEVENVDGNGTVVEQEKQCKPASNETASTAIQGSVEATQVYAVAIVFSLNGFPGVSHFDVPCHPVRIAVTMEWDDPYGTAGDWGLLLDDCTDSAVSSTGKNPVTLESSELIPSTECTLRVVETGNQAARVVMTTFTWDGSLEFRKEAES